MSRGGARITRTGSPAPAPGGSRDVPRGPPCPPCPQFWGGTTPNGANGAEPSPREGDKGPVEKPGEVGVLVGARACRNPIASSVNQLGENEAEVWKMKVKR